MLPSDEGYRIARLVFAADNLGAIAKEWKSRDVPFQRVEEDPEKALVLPLSEATGVPLVVISSGAEV